MPVVYPINTSQNVLDNGQKQPFGPTRALEMLRQMTFEKPNPNRLTEGKQAIPGGMKPEG